MAYKEVDSYHSNKCTKHSYFDKELNKFTIPDEYMRLYGIEIELEFDEAHQEDCDECDGTGRIYYDTDCEECGGSGHVTETQMDDEGNEIEVEVEVDCEECTGNGTIEESRDCDNCNGTGSVDSDDWGDQDIPDELEDTCVFEHDGSLDNGFEVISEPMNYLGMMTWLNTPWLFDMLESSVQGGAGVHLHVSKPDFSEIKKIMLFFARYGNDIGNLTRFSSFGEFYGIYDEDRDIVESCNLNEMYLALRELPDNFETDYNTLNFSNYPNTPQWLRDAMRNRYTCVNLNNSKTLEFRFFDYTRDPSRLQSYVTFIDNLLDLLSQLTLDEVLLGHFAIPNLNTITYEPTAEIRAIEQVTYKDNWELCEEAPHGEYKDYFTRQLNPLRPMRGQRVVLDETLMRTLFDVQDLPHSGVRSLRRIFNVEGWGIHDKILDAVCVIMIDTYRNWSDQIYGYEVEYTVGNRTHRSNIDTAWIIQTWTNHRIAVREWIEVSERVSTLQGYGMATIA